MQVLTAGHPTDPAGDMALSHAVLREVAAGRLPDTARVYLPGPTLAFGRLDRLAPGFERARDAATTRGWTPVVRLGGGHAAAYDTGSVVVEVVRSVADVVTGTQARFAEVSALMVDALAGLGVAVNVEQQPGEYCPGRWSLRLPHGPKVAGVAQRTLKGASLVTAVLVVDGTERLRDVLIAAYDALGLDLRPRTIGAVRDAHPELAPLQVRDALVGLLRTRFAAEPAAVDAATCARARELLAQERIRSSPAGLKLTSGAR